MLKTTMTEAHGTEVVEMVKQNVKDMSVSDILTDLYFLDTLVRAGMADAKDDFRIAELRYELDCREVRV